MGKHILLGVTGGIAAYKAAELARALVKRGMTVQVVMTRMAREFVGPMTFAALTGRKVYSELIESPFEPGMHHIDLARSADLVIVAPATANFIAKYASGMADDLLSTILLATKAPVIIAPAMNSAMYANPAVEQNIRTIRERGSTIVDPDSGELACGETGDGRLAEVAKIVSAAAQFLETPNDMAGLKVVVTAGPTIEPIDDVRYITNRSSGKMGLAVALAAAERGAEVELIHGPITVDIPAGIKSAAVYTAAEMKSALLERFPVADILVMSAAVCDYRPKRAVTGKIKKTGGGIALDLVENDDILKSVAALKKTGQIVVGFAAETADILDNARKKIDTKKVDLIFVNDVGSDPSIFGGDYNQGWLIVPDAKPVRLERAGKARIANAILDKTMEIAKTNKAGGKTVSR